MFTFTDRATARPAPGKNAFIAPLEDIDPQPPEAARVARAIFKAVEAYGQTSLPVLEWPMSSWYVTNSNAPQAFALQDTAEETADQADYVLMRRGYLFDTSDAPTEAGPLAKIPPKHQNVYFGALAAATWLQQQDDPMPTEDDSGDYLVMHKIASRLAGERVKGDKAARDQDNAIEQHEKAASARAELERAKRAKLPETSPKMAAVASDSEEDSEDEPQASSWWPTLFGGKMGDDDWEGALNTPILVLAFETYGNGDPDRQKHWRAVMEPFLRVLSA